jgi:hypothetical protein
MKNTTAALCRLPLIQATRTPKALLDSELKNDFGIVTISGCLGQAHAEILEVMLSNFEDSIKDDFGCVYLLLDPYVLSKEMSRGAAKNYGVLAVGKLIDDLQDAKIRMVYSQRRVKNDDTGRIIDLFGKTLDCYPNPLKNSLPRLKWRVKLGSLLMNLLEKDVQISINSSTVGKAKSGIAQSILRRLLTHSVRSGHGFNMDREIQNSHGRCVAGSELRKMRMRIREDAPVFCELGFEVSEKTINKK